MTRIFGHIRSNIKREKNSFIPAIPTYPTRTGKQKKKKNQNRLNLFFLPVSWSVHGDPIKLYLFNCRPRAFHLHSIKMGQGHEQP